MTPTELFASIGPALYGSKWKSDMAEALGVSEGMIRHYAEGRKPIHPPTWSALAGLIEERRDTLAGLAKTVKEAAR